MTLTGLAYLIIGAFVAAAHHYFSRADDLEGVLSAIIAILTWPLLLIGVEIRITDRRALESAQVPPAAVAAATIARS